MKHELKAKKMATEKGNAEFAKTIALPFETNSTTVNSYFIRLCFTHFSVHGLKMQARSGCWLFKKSSN